MEYYSVINMNKLELHAHKNKPHKDNVDQKKLDTKEKMLFDSLYIEWEKY